MSGTAAPDLRPIGGPARAANVATPAGPIIAARIGAFVNRLLTSALPGVFAPIVPGGLACSSVAQTLQQEAPHCVSVSDSPRYRPASSS